MLLCICKRHLPTSKLMEQELSVRMAQFVQTARQTMMMRDFQKKKLSRHLFLFSFKLNRLDKVLFVKGISHFQIHGARIVCEKAQFVHAVSESQTDKDSGDSLKKKNSCLSLLGKTSMKNKRFL